MFSSVLQKIKRFISKGKKESESGKQNPIMIYSPISGTVVIQKEIPDESFSEGYMGVGIGIKPSEDPEVLVPLSGVLEVLFKTKHAYIVREQSTQIAVMLHIGINTVNIDPEKEAFITSLVEGQEVVEKSPLCQMNLSVIRENATSDISALLVQNENMENRKVEFHKLNGEAVQKGELIMSIV